jgi:MarR-like DNA-binding transcriptional regulator SgrR of sgrS sRNA
MDAETEIFHRNKTWRFFLISQVICHVGLSFSKNRICRALEQNSLNSYKRQGSKDAHRTEEPSCAA